MLRLCTGSILGLLQQYKNCAAITRSFASFPKLNNNILDFKYLTSSRFIVPSCGLSSTDSNSEEYLKSKMPDGYIVGHDQGNKMFYITFKDQDGSASKRGKMAKLDYDFVRPNLVDLYHTEVPPEFQGHGIAKLLAKAAFDHFCEKDIHFRPSCTYLQKYLKDNPIPRYLDNMDKNFN